MSSRSRSAATSRPRRSRCPLELLRAQGRRRHHGPLSPQTGESLLVADAANCEFAHPIPGRRRSRSRSSPSPLRYGSRVIGVIVISKLGLDQFDEDDVRLLEVLAGHAAVALENARLYEARGARRRARRRCSSSAASSRPPRASTTSWQRVVELTRRTCSSRAQARSGSRRRTASSRREAARPHAGGACDRRGAPLRRSEGAQGFSAGAEPFVLGPADWTRIEDEPLDAGASYAVAPIEVDGRAGCIVAARPDGDFGERELRLLGGLAHQAKLAIANASSYEGLERTFVSTVEALANALEANDEYTSPHARWITDLSLRVGEALGLDERDAQAARARRRCSTTSARSGSRATSSRSPAGSPSTERAMIETHPELGERIIAPIDRLQDVRPIVRHCHERWDGARLPRRHRRRGDPARVAHHLRLRRVPRDDDRPSVPQRLSHPEALRRLKEGAGTQFDPQVVEVALGVLDVRAREAPGRA